MSKVDQSLEALESRDWSSVEVDTRPRRNVSVTLSVRMPQELMFLLAREAERRATTPSEVVRDLVAGLGEADESTTVRLADVHRAINSLTHKSV